MQPPPRSGEAGCAAAQVGRRASRAAGGSGGVAHGSGGVRCGKSYVLCRTSYVLCGASYVLCRAFHVLCGKTGVGGRLSGALPRKRGKGLRPSGNGQEKGREPYGSGLLRHGHNNLTSLLDFLQHGGRSIDCKGTHVPARAQYPLCGIFQNAPRRSFTLNGKNGIGHGGTSAPCRAGCYLKR